MTQLAEAHISSNGAGPAHAAVYSGQMQDARQLAEAFYKNGMEAYEQILIGEEPAKLMYLSLLAMGGNNGMAGLVIGPPGGGKSTMLENGHKVVDGINPEHVANVPHREDLTPAKLVGDNSEMVREGERDGGSFREAFSAKVVPILRPGIKVVKFDEITRTSPLALNAGLKVTQDGRIEVVHNGEDAEVSEFDLIVSSMNNFGTMFTHNLDPAVVSRHAMGAFMGVRTPGELGEAGTGIFDNPYQRYNNDREIETATTLEDLHSIRAAIDHVEINAGEREYGKQILVKMLDALEDNRVNMADGRAADQVLRIARTLSMFRGRPAVDEQDLRDAAGYGITARLGATGHQTKADIDGVIQTVLS